MNAPHPDPEGALSALDPACSHFVAKWQQRQPEMRLAEVFCPPAEKARMQAWGALLNELTETLFELGEPTVAAAKTAWWSDELAGMAQGRHRHPLSTALAIGQAPWQALGRELILLAAGEARAADTAEAVQLLVPAAAAVIEVEAALFNAASDAEAARAMAVHWLLQRLPGGLASDDRARIPMHLLARHGLTPAQLASGQSGALLRDWAGELLAVLPTPSPNTALIRRSQFSFDRARLRRLAAGRPPTPPAPLTLWHAWGAARRH